MKFAQPAPTLGYRKNLILHALMEIELLCESDQILQLFERWQGGHRSRVLLSTETIIS